MLNLAKHTLQNTGHFESILKGFNTGLYECGIADDACWWSSQFFEILGLKEGEIEPNMEAFIHLAKPKERAFLRAKINEFAQQKEVYSLEIQLKHQSGVYKWYRLTGQAHWAKNEPKYLTGFLTDIHERITTELRNKKNELLMEEVSLMAKVGGWEIKLDPFEGIWSKEMSIIHDLPPDYVPLFEEVMTYVKPEYRPMVNQAISDAINKGVPYDFEAKIITAKKREIWIRIMGKPVVDPETDKIIGIRGVSQDIDERKERELALKASYSLIHEQNERLVNFANIVSHNLRSHSSNLELTLSLLDLETDEKEISHLKDNLHKISKGLNQTLESLKDIVVINNNTAEIKVPVKFESALAAVILALETEIELVKPTIHTNFEEYPEIEYIPAYLESILLNLMSNAIKYRNPDRPLEINITTGQQKGKAWLRFQDNGLGIDLKKHKSEVFMINKTFHTNPNARGVGLFITKNQIESLGGTIDVESEVNVGTTFTINF